MRKLRKVYSVCSAALIAAFAVSSYADESAISFVPSGFTSLREGQVVKGMPEHQRPDSKVDNVWVQEMNTGINMQAKFSTLPLTGNLGMEMKVCNDNVQRASDLGTTRRLNFYPYLSRADLIYTPGDKENPSLVVDAGYFPFKYNGDSRNLGEYLFRSGTYPQYLITNFDFPMSRLMGARVSGYPSDKFKWDVLATTNIEWTAIGDLNLSGLLSWKPSPLLELGLGGSWCSILSVNRDNTSPIPDPKEKSNAYIYKGKKYFYTFAGQKAMGRLSLDFKSILPRSDFFGKQDLKLYSEAAILGLINYPKSMDGYTQYDTLWQRMPIMAGLNWPTHPLVAPLSATVPVFLYNFAPPSYKFTGVGGVRVLTAAGTGIAAGAATWLLGKLLHRRLSLDLLSVETEWFGNQYPNDMNQIVFDNLPTALSSMAEEQVGTTYLNNHQDDIKWSLYGRKTFLGHLNVSFQFANDHMRWYHLDYSQSEWREALRDSDNWYYTIKFGYTF
jgi:hypothetical protein